MSNLSRPHRICIDLRPLQVGHESRGIGMHIRSVLEHLPKDPEIDYIFYAYDKNNPIKKLAIDIPAPYTLVQTKTIKKSLDSPRDVLKLMQVIWHKYKPLRGMKIDTFLQFDFMFGLPRFPETKTVLIAYDLIPIIYKNDYLPSPLYSFVRSPGRLNKGKKAIRAAYYRWRYHLHYKNFQRADSVVSISQATKGSLVKLLHVPDQKVIVAPLAPVIRSQSPQKPSGLSSVSQFIFYIGATDSRKRVQDLVEAFDGIRNKTDTISLVLAGKEFKTISKIPNLAIRRAIQESRHKEAIKVLGFVSDSEKLWLYQNATAFVFPTRYEGFGLPVIESLKLGCPTISYNNSSIPEVSQGAALLVDTDNVLGLQQAIEEILTNQRLRKQLRAKGQALAKLYTWDSHVATLMQVAREGRK